MKPKEIMDDLEGQIARIRVALKAMYDLHRCKGGDDGGPCEVCEMHYRLTGEE